MTINVVEESSTKKNIPEKLVEIEDYNRTDAVRSREFVMSGMGPMVNINGKQMDMNRIDEKINVDELEEWVISNEYSGGMGVMMGMIDSTPHPYHVNGVLFSIIERYGSKYPFT